CRTVALSLIQGNRSGAGGHCPRQRRYRDRHAQDSVARCALQKIGASHHRRRTPLRGTPERGPEETAGRSGCADAYRHAHSAHAGHVAGRHPRFSVIATAPQKRLAIKTFVRREDKSTIREALLRELKRGGQAYFLHNEVETIHNRRAMLEELVPEARIAVAHGQMPERELEEVMKGFYQQRYNVLLCTTIIETGIDVPTANTIVIHRADRLGLAQLHQLRGRVGRSHHQAYAYLLTPPEDAITSNAKKRLEAIQAMEELG